MKKFKITGLLLFIAFSLNCQNSPEIHFINNTPLKNLYIKWNNGEERKLEETIKLPENANTFQIICDPMRDCNTPSSYSMFEPTKSNIEVIQPEKIYYINCQTFNCQCVGDACRQEIVISDKSMNDSLRMGRMLPTF